MGEVHEPEQLAKYWHLHARVQTPDPQKHIRLASHAWTKSMLRHQYKLTLCQFSTRHVPLYKMACAIHRPAARLAAVTAAPEIVEPPQLGSLRPAAGDILSKNSAGEKKTTRLQQNISKSFWWYTSEARQTVRLAYRHTQKAELLGWLYTHPAEQSRRGSVHSTPTSGAAYTARLQACT